jgi:serine/threonine protein phosphatase PrpC
VIPRDRAHLFISAVTHAGMSGKNNEDRYAVTAHRLSETDATSSVFAIVADGIGGHRAGEIAAEIAVDTISHAVTASDATQPQETLEEAIIQASEEIHFQATSDENQQGMGATCACVWVIEDRLYTASVGDSRIYLIRNSSIRQLTTDHTWIQEAIEHGILKPEQARGHPRSHVIRRYLGSKTPVKPDFRLRLSPDEDDEQALANQGTQLLPGDLLFLCSDGLTDLVDDNEILAAIQGNKMEKALNQLVDLANERGGHDNITIVSLQVPKGEEETLTKISLQKPRRRTRVSWVSCAIAGALIGFVILLLAGAIWYATRPAATPTPIPPTDLPVVIETLEVTDTLYPTEAPLPTETPIPTVTASPKPSQTPIQATYTPWPTATDSAYLTDQHTLAGISINPPP